MPNVLQDYFNRMTALNRQRGMTGNMQYGKALDSSLAEGYFDSYNKNKMQSQSLANQKRSLDLQAMNSVMNYGLQNKAMSQSNLLGWGSTGAQLLTTAGTLLYDNYQKNQQQKAIDAKTKAMLAQGQLQQSIPYSSDPNDPGYVPQYYDYYDTNFWDSLGPDVNQYLDYDVSNIA